MITLAERILTNQLLIDDLDLWFDLDSKSIDDPEVKKYFKLIDELIDSQINESIDWLESDEAKEKFFGELEAQKEIFEALEDAWDSILDGSYDSVDELLDEIYQVGKEKGYENIQETLRYTDADKQAIRICKDYNFHLIRKLDNDLRGTVKNKILQGIISGENPYDLARDLVNAGIQQLDGSTFTPKQRATMIAKTETSRMQNTGMLQSYINEGYTQVKILTAEDDDVCYTCLRYAYEFNEDSEVTFANAGEERVHNIVKLIKGGLFPPFHPNCRCTYLTVWEGKTDPPENPYIIDLTPNNYLPDAIFRRFKDDWGLTSLNNEIDITKWSKEIIYDKLKDIADPDDDLEKISDIIFNFIKNAANYHKESGLTYDDNFNPISEFIESKSEKFFDVPDDDVSEVEGTYFGLVGHSHTNSKVPLPDWHDMEVGIFNLNIKYNIIYAPGYGVTVIKKSNPKIKPDKEKVEESYWEADEKRKDYVNDNITRASDKYKQKVKDDFHVSYFEQSKQTDYIADVVRHSNFKEQCEFYNKELAQYGIEFVYIEP